MEINNEDVIRTKILLAGNVLEAVVNDLKQETKTDNAFKWMIIMLETALQIICNIHRLIWSPIPPSKMAITAYYALHDMHRAMNAGFPENWKDEDQWPDSRSADLQQDMKNFSERLERRENPEVVVIITEI